MITQHIEGKLLASAVYISSSFYEIKLRNQEIGTLNATNTPSEQKNCPAATAALPAWLSCALPVHPSQNNNHSRIGL